MLLLSVYWGVDFCAGDLSQPGCITVFGSTAVLTPNNEVC